MSVNQRDFAPRSGAEGDAARCIRDSLPRLLTGQRCSLQTKSYAYKAQEDKLNPYRRSEASKLKLPPIRDTAKLRELSANNIKELKNQNYVLQQQLKDSKTENKILKNVLHRHTVALQQYQDLDGSISQIQDQHRNEVKALRKLLAETRSSRDNLARKLQSTERELLDCKDRISHLQWRVNRNPNLLEKEELTRRLSEFTIQLEEKDRRIQFLEKSNMLLQGSLNRQVATEYKNMSKTNEMSLGLQSTVSELSKKTQLDRTREAETNNINTIRSRKHGRKAKQSKMVQTEKLGSTTSEADSRIKSDLSGTDERVQRWQSPDSSDYVPHKSRTTEQRRKNSQRHSDKKSACGDAQYRQEERPDSSEDTQESEESDEEEDEEKEKSRDEDDKGEEEEQEEEENEDREGQGRSEGHNGEGKEEKEEHDDEDYEDEGMDQNVEEETEETEGKEQKSEETRLEETFEETRGEHEEGEEWDYEDEDEEQEEEEEEEVENKENDEKVYVEVQLEERKNKENEKKKKKKDEEDDDEGKKKKKKKEED
ncbi:glutamic acid-rich protein-like, partial [Hippocampus comes]|uniref:glutamic acid-rich protein-like n=1 Tax=Hippocampus comes TaxID=109280 RepID=UPI00094E74DB